ncbi:MAG: alpha-mannosidase [Cyanophyceae cyanobacterium]
MDHSPAHAISQTIENLRQLTQVDVQAGWHCYAGELNFADRTSPAQVIKPSDWQLSPLNDKRYITWPAGRRVRWLAQQFVIPQHLQGYPLAGLSLRLVLTWWAEEAKIYVNGQLVQEGDLFDSSARVLLTDAATPGNIIIVTLRLVSPGHDIGALMQSRCVYETEKPQDPDSQDLKLVDPGFVADELTVLHNYLEAFAPEKLATLATILTAIDWKLVTNAEQFERSLRQLRHRLLPLAAGIQQRCLHLLGHAHLDLAWLWPVEETWEVAERTFTSVLGLQQEFPHLTFCHSTPALYAWIEEHRPELFKAVQAAVMAGRWEVVGGMWVEPDANLLSGESLIRQLLYGQRYTQEKFGQLTKVAWLPDSFGFTWQLPQILKAGGIEYFVTGKLHWNDSTPFPHGVFWWQSPDGTRLLTLMSPPNLAGVMDTNPVIMSRYAVDWEQQTHLKDAFWLPGVGDHGGGPSRDMLEVQQRAAQSPFFPRFQWTTATQYLEQIASAEPQSSSPPSPALVTASSFPTWNDELYLELHRGCYTTHAEQKYFNRYGEGLLYQAELWATLAAICTSSTAAPYSYPQEPIKQAWKKLLFNQFHDILPGTSIPEVFVDANQAWQAVVQAGTKIVSESLEAIASHIAFPQPPHPEAQPVVVFNALNWQRTEVVAYPIAQNNRTVIDLEGNQIPTQCSEQSLLFVAETPSVGYRLYWICPSLQQTQPLNLNREFVLENEKLRVVINPVTGNLDSIFDQAEQREVLGGPGNQLQAFRDRGQYWDAWNIDPDYAQHPLPPAQLISIEWIDQGPVQWRVRVRRRLGQSEFCQDYILQARSPLLKIATTVDWQESHVLVKAAFPLSITSNTVTCEIPCGAIQRPTQPQTPAERAKWEIPALRWADLTDVRYRYGVSLLNDCKYGYDSQPQSLRLTLLRASRWPDSNADRGIHHFTYALYPHQGDWQAAQTVRAGYELNIPLQVREAGRTADAQLSPTHQFLNLSSNNVVLMALKQSEGTAHEWVMRCYECWGEETQLAVTGDLDWEITSRVDGLERPLPSAESKPYLPVKPWKITSLRLRAHPLK